jgi:4a-hydroxytetrahydrobiopterin dehydratase
MSLTEKRCMACEGEIPALSKEEIVGLAREVPKWRLAEDGKSIRRSFTFENYYQTMAFVNAVAWLAHQEGHHPDLEVHYSRCEVRYSTHAIDGLTENDFICAAKVDRLFCQ